MVCNRSANGRRYARQSPGRSSASRGFVTQYARQSRVQGSRDTDIRSLTLISARSPMRAAVPFWCSATKKGPAAFAGGAKDRARYTGGRLRAVLSRTASAMRQFDGTPHRQSPARQGPSELGVAASATGSENLMVGYVRSLTVAVSGYSGSPPYSDRHMCLI